MSLIAAPCCREWSAAVSHRWRFGLLAIRLIVSKEWPRILALRRPSGLASLSFAGRVGRIWHSRWPGFRR